MLRLVVFVALVAIVCGETTQVSECTVNPGALPVNAYIEGCITPPCGLPQLEDVIINIVFRAPRTIHNMTTLATAYVPVPILPFPMPVPYALGDNAVTCNFLQNSYCPLLEGEIILYTLHMFIQETFPVGIAPTIEFRIHDDNNVSIMCIRVPIVIREPRSRHAPHNATLIVDAN